MANRRRSVTAQPSFTAEQHERLKQCGLLDARIVELDSILPLIRASRERLAPLAAVRKGLGSIEQPLAEARRALDDLMKSSDKGAFELKNRLVARDDAPTAVLKEEGDILKRTLEAVEHALNTIARARRSCRQSSDAEVRFPCMLQSRGSLGHCGT